MKKILLLSALLLGYVLVALGGNVNVVNPDNKPVPVTFVTKVGGAVLATTTYSGHITTNATTNVTSATAYVSTMQVSVSGAGTSWALTIRTKEATPKILYTASAAVGSVTPINVTVPIVATSGIEILTAGTTPGVVDVWITYAQ